MIHIKIACLWYHCHSNAHHHMSLACCRESHHTHTTLTPPHTTSLFSIDLHTVRQHLLVTHFRLHFPISGTLFLNDILLFVILFDILNAIICKTIYILCATTNITSENNDHRKKSKIFCTIKLYRMY